MSQPEEQFSLPEKNKTQFVQREAFTIPTHSKSSKTTLSVTFPDGKNISHRFAYETLMDTIKAIGHEKVKQLNMLYCGVQIVSSTRDDFYTQHELSKGVYIMTHSSTKIKKEQLEEISKALNLNLKIEIL